jgi:hypothetical protein
MRPEPSGSIACSMLCSDGRAIADRIIAARGNWHPMDSVYMDCTADTFIDKPAIADNTRACADCGRITSGAHAVCTHCQALRQYRKGNPLYACPICGSFKNLVARECRQCYNAGHVSRKLPPVRAIVHRPEPETPLCFPLSGDWDDYAKAAKRVQKGRVVWVMCADCLPVYQAEMKDAGRCTRPDVEFREHDGGIVGIGKGVLREKDT